MTTHIKNKKIAILLAILFGPYVWLYTYHKENKTIVTAIIIWYTIFIFIGFINPIALLIFPLPVWVWSLISTIIKKELYFISYMPKNINDCTKNKEIGKNINNINKEIYDLNKDLNKNIELYNSIKNFNFGSIIFLLFFCFIIGGIIGLIFKSVFVFWLIFVGPTILIISQTYSLKYKIKKQEREEAKLRQYKLKQIEHENFSRMAEIENEYKEHNKKNNDEFYKLRLERKKNDTMYEDEKHKHLEKRKNSIEQKNLSRIDIINKFKDDLNYKFIKNFVKQNEINSSTLANWIIITDKLKNTDNFLILGNLCKNNNISINYKFDYPELLEGELTKLEKLEDIDIDEDIDIWWSSEEKELFENIDDLQELLKHKGFDLNVAEVVYLLIKEQLTTEIEDLENKILSKNPKTMADYIICFLDNCPDYTKHEIICFSKILKNNKITIDSKTILQEIKKIEKQKKLNALENKLMRVVDFNITIKDVDLMSGYDFEKFLVKLYKKMNYKIIQHTALSNDQGADLIVEKNLIKYVIQAKRYMGKVSNSAIQQVVASIKHYNVDNGVVITNATFTASAIALAKSNKIELIDRPKLIKLIKEYL
jgi:HJR/Mrr/RecB family endonuclease